jgi:FKBP-type peptidyl-prolyl cis-trans isomerase FkpA
MKFNLLPILAISFYSSLNATIKDSVVNYNLHDSVKVMQFMAEINVQSVNSKKESFAGIKTNVVKLSLESDNTEKEIVFEFPKSASVMAKGINVDAGEKGELGFKYNWGVNESYRLLISIAVDSAENFSLYSAYAWLNQEKKWKLIGTCKISGTWKTIQNPATFFSQQKKGGIMVNFRDISFQHIKGKWENMKGDSIAAPVINLAGHIDSVQQTLIDKKIIEDAIASGKTDVKENAGGIYYKILKEGTGKQVSVDDMVTIFYKGYLFTNDSIFDQTKEKPATFPLKRLIKGWQIGLPLCKVGGKIKIVIPSDMSYSIRTRPAKIPPNSILVFEIEVLDAKSP